jgi:hypothetical protein
MNTWNITDDGTCIYFRKGSNTNYVAFDWNSNIAHIVGNSTSTACGYGWHNKEAADDLAYVGANIQQGKLSYFWIGKDYANLWMKISPTGHTEFMSSAEDTAESVATFATSGANPWIYFKNNGTTKVASVGYYNNMACLSNEKNLARIGVTDTGIPQYWTNSTGAAKYEIILGNAYENNVGPLRLQRGSGINNATNNYISAGRGYSTGSGLNGLKLIVIEQDDAISGLG